MRKLAFILSLSLVVGLGGQVFALPIDGGGAGSDQALIDLTIEEYVNIDIIEPQGEFGYSLTLNPGPEGYDTGSVTVDFNVECNYTHSVSVAVFEGVGADWDCGEVNYGPHGPGSWSGDVDVTATVTWENLAGFYGAILILQVDDLRID